MSFPFLPGIPPLLAPIVAGAATVLAPQIAELLQINAPVWGLFDSSAKQVITPDTFLGIDYINSHRISDYPVEQGSFANYNTVQNPFDARVRMARGGTENDRANFLLDLENIANSLELYTLITPEKVYTNVSLESFDYRRETHNGAGMIVANIHFVEIRLAALQYTPQPTTVPPAQVTNSTTSKGTISKKATVPHAQAKVSVGQVAPKPAPVAAVNAYKATPSVNYKTIDPHAPGFGPARW
jgi:hypothetical protein